MFPSPLQRLEHIEFDRNKINVFIKRDDLIHPHVSGNKWRKLKYNLEQAKAQGSSSLLTFGGAYSNHIYSCAAAAKVNNFSSIGIIRGDDLEVVNPTLSFAVSQGMQLHFVSRSEYRNRNSEDYLKDLKKKFPGAFMIPEGGSNRYAIDGVKELVSELNVAVDFLLTPVGTSGTISGLLEGMRNEGKVIGVSALKGIAFDRDIKSWSGFTNYEVWSDYHFGGYAKVTQELLDFVMWFRNTFSIALDPVYTSKMAFAFWNRLKSFPANSNIVLLHTGGLQGWNGMIERGLVHKSFVNEIIGA